MLPSGKKKGGRCTCQKQCLNKNGFGDVSENNVCRACQMAIPILKILPTSVDLGVSSLCINLLGAKWLKFLLGVCCNLSLLSKKNWDHATHNLELGDLRRFQWWYPVVMTNIAMENGPVEIVSFPVKNCDVSWLCWSLPEGKRPNSSKFQWKLSCKATTCSKERAGGASTFAATAASQLNGGDMAMINQQIYRYPNAINHPH